MSEDRGPPRMLMSYGVLGKSVDVTRAVERMAEGGHPRPTILADSGAFTANKLGTPMDPHDYARWLDRWGEHFDYAISLDVIHDVEASWRSHQNIEQITGRRLMPVVHYPEGVEVFDRYREAGHRLIAVGGLGIRGRYSPGVRYRWLINLFRWAEVNDVRFHGLGIGSFPVMYGLPWYSVDASSWSAAYVYGMMWMFDGDQGEMRRLVRNRRNSYDDRNARVLRSRGIDPARAADRFTRYWGGIIAADSYRRAEAWIRTRRGIIAPPTDGTLRRGLPEPEGIRVYLAVISECDMLMISGGTDSYRRGGIERRWVPLDEAVPVA